MWIRRKEFERLENDVRELQMQRLSDWHFRIDEAKRHNAIVKDLQASIASMNNDALTLVHRSHAALRDSLDVELPVRDGIVVEGVPCLQKHPLATVVKAIAAHLGMTARSKFADPFAFETKRR